MVRLGHDGEFMLANDEGSIIPVVGLLGGTKLRPIMVKSIKGGYQEDNVNAEVGIMPTSSITEWVSRTKNIIQKVAEVTALTPVFKPSHYFNESQLTSRQASNFGCSPDYNAYTGKRNRRPCPSGTLRSAGGHIHFELPSYADKRSVIRSADLLISVPLVLMDEDTERRSLYGKAGAYRIKSYGVEYRTPSCYWLSDETLMRWVFKQAQRCVTLDMRDFPIPPKKIIRSINTSDKVLAKEIWDTTKEVYGE